MWIVYALLALLAVVFVTNWLSYRVLKRRILERQRWDLNICCGKTDGGGINADIVAHTSLPNMVIVDVYRLPFLDKAFDHVLCSHTIEHVDDPEAFYTELSRVGRQVMLVLPPLWDSTAAFNLLEHRWLFLTLKKEHTNLPPHIRLPVADWIQHSFGQRIKA